MEFKTVFNNISAFFDKDPKLRLAIVNRDSDFDDVGGLSATNLFLELVKKNHCEKNIFVRWLNSG